jgi:hypothetical protein
VFFSFFTSVIYSRGKATEALNIIKANINMPLGNAGVQEYFAIVI